MDVVGSRVANSTPSNGDRRVISFRTRRAAADKPEPAGKDDLAAYAHTPEDPADAPDAEEPAGHKQTAGAGTR